MSFALATLIYSALVYSGPFYIFLCLDPSLCLPVYRLYVMAIALLYSPLLCFKTLK